MKFAVGRRRVLARALSLVALVSGFLAGDSRPPACSRACPNKRPFPLLHPTPNRDLGLLLILPPFNLTFVDDFPSAAAACALHLAGSPSTPSSSEKLRSDCSPSTRMTSRADHTPSSSAFPTVRVVPKLKMSVVAKIHAVSSPSSSAPMAVLTDSTPAAPAGVSGARSGRLLHGGCAPLSACVDPVAAFLRSYALSERCAVQLHVPRALCSCILRLQLLFFVKMHGTSSSTTQCMQGFPLLHLSVEAGEIQRSEVALVNSGYVFRRSGKLELGLQVHPPLLASSRIDDVVFNSKVWHLIRNPRAWLLRSRFIDVRPFQLESGVAPNKSTARLPTSDAKSGSIARGVVGDASIGRRRRDPWLLSLRFLARFVGRYRSPSLEASAVVFGGSDFLVFKLVLNLSLFMIKTCLIQNLTWD